MGAGADEAVDKDFGCLSEVEEKELSMAGTVGWEDNVCEVQAQSL